MRSAAPTPSLLRLASKLASLAAGNISTGDLSLREAIVLANSSPGANTITFATSTNSTEFNLSLGQFEIIETLTITGNGATKTIIDAQQNRTNDAKQIMNLKRRWPLAMQSQNLEEFEAILAKEFTFKGIGEFFNRTDYIKNRIKPDDWKITFVKYDNLCLQFINDLAILK